MSHRASRSWIRIAAVCFIAVASGCQEDLASDGDVMLTAGALLTNTAGTQYAQTCNANGVPLPPSWGASTIGPGQWIDDGDTTNSYISNEGRVYHWIATAGPPGMCVILAHAGGGTFDVICQGTNGNACFWEKAVSPSPPPTTPLIIAGLTIPSPTVLGGKDLLDHGVLQCTHCHRGENAFITHANSGHPLNLISLPQWMPAPPANVFNPIVATGWFENPGPSTTNVPASCTTSNCHVAPAFPGDINKGGRFPTLSRMPPYQAGADSYCSILAKVVNRPSNQGGMPMGISCTENVNCARQTDPAVRAMLAACGAPSPALPSVSGTDSPGVPAKFLSNRVHVSSNQPGLHRHGFTSATTTMPNAGCCAGQVSRPALAPGDAINVWVYPSVDNPPTEIMVEVFDGTNWFRPYWGANNINLSNRSFRGPLPQPGVWTVLSFRPADIGMPGNPVVSGMSFTLFDGTASWADVLFRISDPGFNNQFVSQVWIADRIPAGGQPFTANDEWRFRTEPFAPFNFSDMSTRYNPSVWGPDRGNDDNADGNINNSSVFHTSNTTNSTSVTVGPGLLQLGTGGEYWWVDMNSTRTVRKVVLYNRTDCCMDRLSHFRINYFDAATNKWKVASDQSNTITGPANAVIPIEFSAVNTRYIMVQKTDNNYLHLAEVDVIGDP